MDSKQLFWATGIDNTGLQQDVNAAGRMFEALAKKVETELGKITTAYANMKDTLSFNDVKSQVSDLARTIREQGNAVKSFGADYDKALDKIRKSANNIGNGVTSSDPLRPTVENIKKSVHEGTEQLSYFQMAMRRAATYLSIYAAFNWSKDFVRNVVQVKGQFDQLRVAIDSFVGSAEKGQEVFNGLTSLAVKSPFQLTDITDSAKQMLAYGDAADSVVNSIKMLSDVSAGSGQSLKDIAYLYGTSMTQGRLYARDLFQFANRGIPIYQELAKVMGISTTELMKQVTAGKVGFEQLRMAVENMTSAGGKYFGLSDKLAETTYGKISNLQDKWTIAMNEIGTATDGIVSGAVEGITVLIENWETVGKVIGATVVTLGAYKAAMIAVSIANSYQATKVIPNLTMQALGFASATKTLTFAQWANVKATNALNAAMSANPYVMLAIAVTAVVGAIYVFSDGLSDAERSAKKASKAIDDIKNSVDALNKKAEDALNVIYSNTAAESEQIRALETLKQIYPQIYKNMSLVDVQRQRSYDLQKQQNEEAERSIRIGLKTSAVLAKNAYLQAQSNFQEMQSLPSSQRVLMGNEYTSAGKNVEDLKVIYETIAKEADKMNASWLESLKPQKQTTETLVKNKAYWEEQLKLIEDSKAALTSSEMAGQKGQKLLREEAEIRKQLKVYQSSDKYIKDSERKNTLQAQSNKLLEDAAQKEQSIQDTITKAQAAQREQELNNMKDGYAKRLALIQAEYDKEYAEAEKQANALVKKAQEVEEANWKAKNPNWKKEGKTFTPTTTSTSQIAGSEALFNTPYEKMVASTTNLLNDMLDKYSDFDAKRRKIDEDYNDLVSTLQKQRTENNAKDIDSAIAQAGKERTESLAKIDFEQFKDSEDWQLIFGDLKDIPTNIINKLVEELQRFKSSSKDLPIQEYKELISAFEKLNDEAIKRNPFTEMSDSAKEYKKASDEVKEIQEEVNRLISSGKENTDEYTESVKKLKKAQADQQASANKFNKSKNDILEYAGQVVEAGNDMINVFENLGVSVSESIKGMMSGFSEMISGLENIDITKPFSIVTGSIKTMSGFTKTLSSLFGGSDSTAKYEKLKNSLDAYNATLEKAISKQKEFLDSLSGTSAIDASEEAIALVQKQIENYQRLAEAAGSAGSSIGSHSYGYRTNKALKSSWDEISKVVGKTVDNINDFYSMTPEELEKIMTELPGVWSNISGQIREQLEAIIEAGDDIDDILESAKESLTSLSLDEATSSLDDFLLNADSTMADVADNFEDYMRNAMLSLVKDQYLTKALSDWYSDFVDATNSDSELSDSEIEALRKQYLEIYEEANDRLKEMEQIAGVSSTSSSNLKTAIQGITESQADTLTAQLVSMRVHASDISQAMITQNNMLNIMASDISDIAEYTSNLPEMLNIMRYFRNTGMKML